MKAKAQYRRIAAIFAREGWTWRVRDGRSVDPFVPTANEIETTVARLVRHLDAGSSYSESGRLLLLAPTDDERDMPGADVRVFVLMGPVQ